MSNDQTNTLDARLRTAIDKSVSNPVMFFFTTGALWLVVSILLGVLASLKSHWPTFFEAFGELSTGRAYVAHLNVLIYGWCFPAAFGAIIWFMSRLCRKESKHAGIIVAAGLVWNFGVVIGLLGVMLGKSTGVPWMEFPNQCWVIFLFAYILIAIWSFVQFRVREGGHVYISQWYILAALFLFPWIFCSAHIFTFVFDGHPVMTAAVASWFKSSIVNLFFIPVAAASVYYIAPKVTGRPVHSYSLALLGFWTLIILGAWGGIQKLTGAPLPAFMPYVSAAAGVLFFIPALTIGYNILMTTKSHHDLAKKSPSLRFTVASVIALIGMGVAGVFLNLPSVMRGTQFSLSGYGYEILALYGVFSMSMFAAIYYIVPRVTKREWLAPSFIRTHFNLSAYGVIAVVMGSILGGYLQGAAVEAIDQPFSDAKATAYMISIFNSIAWVIILISNLAFLFHILLMAVRLGRHSKHATLIEEHHGSSPHGADGKVNNY